MREIASIRELFDTRLDAMDKAIVLLQAARDHSASINVVEQMVKALKELHEEKFSSVQEQFGSLEKGIQNQFTERDVRTDKLADAGADALAAALLAAKEAVAVAFVANKEAAAAETRANERATQVSSAATTKLLDQIGVSLQTAADATADKFAQQAQLMNAATAAMNDKFGELKDRLSETNARITTIDGRAVGGDRAVTRMGEGWGVFMGIIGAVIGVGGIVAAVAIAIMRGM